MLYYTILGTTVYFMKSVLCGHEVCFFHEVFNFATLVLRGLKTYLELQADRI